MSNTPRIATTAEVADALGVEKETVRRHCRSGEWVATRTKPRGRRRRGGDWRIVVDEYGWPVEREI